MVRHFLTYVKLITKYAATNTTYDMTTTENVSPNTMREVLQMSLCLSSSCSAKSSSTSVSVSLSMIPDRLNKLVRKVVKPVDRPVITLWCLLCEGAGGGA